MITAPFNFVPLNKKVFFPLWADKISHDKPFIDGESGEIDLKITAKSPIFIRNHSNDKDNPSSEFCNYNGEYYIPGSSVKGMIRSVLEIMSFSKLSASLFTDNTYAVRDLNNSKLYMSKMKSDNIYCGWLKKENNEYFIEDCGIPGRIKHKEIDRIFSIEFARNFKKGTFRNRPEDKTAKKKYNLITSNNFTYNFKYLKKDVNREIYIYDQYGDKRGTLVLTGQPSARDEGRDELDESKKRPIGKIYEFIFFQPKDTLKVEDRVLKNFLFAYFDGRKTEPKESVDWTFWKEKLNQGEQVPVFFQKEGNRIIHFGLSYLYKLPYKYSVKDGISGVHFDERLDLAESIFGYVNKDKALKGRVQFSHFKATKNVRFLEEKRETLGTPRASYYPIYVNQEKRVYTTFMDKNVEITGRKRYPIHTEGISNTINTENQRVQTKFRPMREGVVFEGKLRYHNLKKAELGALLSAITFHNTPNTHHNIGLAKSLGYGKIDIEINGIDIEEYLKEFEYNISIQINDWINTKELKELLSMASEQNNRGNSTLEYMPLKDFRKVKNNKEYLKYYTQLEGIQTISLTTLLSEEDLQSIESKREEFLKLQKTIEKARKEQKEYQDNFENIKNASNIAQINNFLSKYEDSEYLVSEDKKLLLKKINDLKEKEQKTEQEEKRKEAEERYQRILNNKTHMENGLKDFIKIYKDSEIDKIVQLVMSANQKLEEITNKNLSSEEKNPIDEIRKASSGKRVNEFLSEELIENNSQELVEAIKECYSKLNKKNKKKFFNEAQIGRVNKDFEAELKSILS